MFRQENNEKTYYDILKIKPDSSDSDVRKAYLELANIYHPDKNPGNKKIATLRFRLINEAYAALKKQEGRERYNRLLHLNQGRPKGAYLKADNDNKPNINDSNIWRDLKNLFTLSKPIDLIKSSNKEHM